MKEDPQIILHDGMDLEGKETGVRRDHDGIPEEWTLLRLGENPMIRNGMPGSLILTEEGMESILRYFREKGELIPVDSNHFLHELASRRGMDEADVLKLLPSGVAAMGFGSLEEKDGLLRFRVQWNPLARELLKEKIFRYFSPAIRGLKQGPLRITSVALENEPAINGLDALAASAGSRHFPELAEKEQPVTEKETKVEEEKHEEKPLVKKNGGSSLIPQIKALLTLDEGVSDDVVLLALKTVLEKAGSLESLRKELEEAEKQILAFQEKEEEKKKTDLIRQGERDGKITPATREWWEKLDSVQLSAHLPQAPVLVRQGGIARTQLAEDRTGLLTAEDRQVCRHFGFTEKEYLDCKQQFRG